jgi:hypothetical protein
MTEPKTPDVNAAIDVTNKLTDDINRYLTELLGEQYQHLPPQAELVALLLNLAAIIYCVTAEKNAEEARSYLGLVNEVVADALEEVIENPDVLNVSRVLARKAARDQNRWGERMH